MINYYFDDKVYKDNVSYKDIILMCGLKHTLNLITSDNSIIDDLKITSSNKIPFDYKDNKLTIDLTKIDEKKDLHFSLTSKKLMIKNEKYNLHLVKKIDFSSLKGSFTDKRGMTIQIEDKEAILTINDLNDDIEKIKLESLTFDVHSLELISKVKDEERDDLIFSFYPKIKVKDKDTLSISLDLEAYDEKTGLNDSYYLIGEGDEDGIIDYEEFKRS